MRILIFGNGWLGKRCLATWGDKAIMSGERITSVKSVTDEIDRYKPDAVLNAAGIVGKPNVDWCEDNQYETFKGNTIIPVMAAEACNKKGVYMLHIGTGCIYYGYKDGGWKECDYANPIATYTRTKYAADLVLQTMPNVGIARIRMPVDHIPHPGNLIDKLISYDKIVDVENSITIVSDMIDMFYELMLKKMSGIYHVVNSGSITHREIIDLYKIYVDASIKKEWITADELVNSRLAKKTRSNNILASSLDMRNVKESMEDLLVQYAINKQIQ